MSEHDEGYPPREHDHLVEPLFGGLGERTQREEAREPTAVPEAEAEPIPAPRAGLLRRLLARFRQG